MSRHLDFSTWLSEGLLKVWEVHLVRVFSQVLLLGCGLESSRRLHILHHLMLLIRFRDHGTISLQRLALNRGLIWSRMGYMRGGQLRAFVATFLTTWLVLGLKVWETIPSALGLKVLLLRLKILIWQKGSWVDCWLFRCFRASGW